MTKHHGDEKPKLKPILDSERAANYGDIYGLNMFDQDGTCKQCGATDQKLNRVTHCKPCQDDLAHNRAKAPESPKANYSRAGRASS